MLVFKTSKIFKILRVAVDLSNLGISNTLIGLRGGARDEIRPLGFFLSFFLPFCGPRSFFFFP
jgi:hypothetical protein